MRLSIIFAFFYWHIHTHASNIEEEEEYYVAAAFQNAIVGCESTDPDCHGRQVQRANLAKFDLAMGEAKKKGADIIVFNEGGIDQDLWAHGKWQRLACEPIPPPSKSIPCDAKDWRNFPVTYNASCLARKHGIVMVIDTCDRQPCKKGLRPCARDSNINCCPASGFEQFNTQLAFSENGELLAKYHKVNNYDTAPDSGESNQLCCWPPRDNRAYFDTSFGVRFGMHICFDILFRKPGLAMAMDPTLGIKDFVYSTHWEAPGPPMLPGIEIQQGWSRGLGVNLIAANAGLGYAHAGSGIYSKGISLALHYNATMERDDYLLVAKVPKLNRQVEANVIKADHSKLGKVLAPPLPAPQFRAFDVLPGADHRVQNISATSDGFTCHLMTILSASVSTDTTDRYLLMAVNGSWFGGVLRSRSCVVLRCGSLSESECAARATCSEYKDASCASGRSLYESPDDLTATTLFDSIELSGNFEQGDVVLPIVGTSLGQVVNHNAIKVEGGHMRASLSKPLLNAMLFAIPQDDEDTVQSNAISGKTATTLLV